MSHSWALIIVWTCAAVLVRLTAVVTDPDRERRSLDALLTALEEARIPHKEAYLLLGISKGQWSEICSGQRHTPSHTRMLNLPVRFWEAYLPRLAWVVMREHVQAVRESLSVSRRAS